MTETHFGSKNREISSKIWPAALFCEVLSLLGGTRPKKWARRKSHFLKYHVKFQVWGQSLLERWFDELLACLSSHASRSWPWKIHGGIEKPPNFLGGLRPPNPLLVGGCAAACGAACGALAVHFLLQRTKKYPRRGLEKKCVGAEERSTPSERFRKKL